MGSGIFTLSLRPKLSLASSFDDAFAISMNLQRSIYAADFKNETTWIAAVRDFQQWATSEKK